jgi:hypothetical protein
MISLNEIGVGSETVDIGYWGATEQKTRLRIQVTSTIEPDGLRSGRNWGMAMIRDRLGHMRLGRPNTHQGQSSPCLLAVAEEELGSYRGRAKARVDRQPGVQIELAEMYGPPSDCKGKVGG